MRDRETFSVHFDTNNRTTILQGLIELIETSASLKVLNIESNFISPELLAKLLRATLTTQGLIEFRAANQVRLSHFTCSFCTISLQLGGEKPAFSGSAGALWGVQTSPRTAGASCSRRVPQSAMQTRSARVLVN